MLSSPKTEAVAGAAVVLGATVGAGAVDLSLPHETTPTARTAVIKAATRFWGGFIGPPGQ